MMVLCRYGRSTNPVERERLRYITDGDPGGLGCPSCTGEIWGFEIFGEPFDEGRRALVGPYYQLLGSRSGDVCSVGAHDRADGIGFVFLD